MPFALWAIRSTVPAHAVSIVDRGVYNRRAYAIPLVHGPFLLCSLDGGVNAGFRCGIAFWQEDGHRKLWLLPLLFCKWLKKMYIGKSYLVSCYSCLIHCHYLRYFLY